MKNLTVEIPDGYKVDLDKSDLSTGKIVLMKEDTDAKCFSDLGEISGFFVDPRSIIMPVDNITANLQNSNVHVTMKQAKSALAFAQLTQLHKAVVGDWVPDWDGEDMKSDQLRDIEKFTLSRVSGIVTIIVSYRRFAPLAFKTRKQADRFLDSHKDLIKIYFEL